MESSVKVFDGIVMTLHVTDDDLLADVREYLRDALHSSYHSMQLQNMDRSEARGNPVNSVPRGGFDLVIQFFKDDDALKFKLVFGGKLLGVV